MAVLHSMLTVQWKNRAAEERMSLTADLLEAVVQGHHLEGEEDQGPFRGEGNWRKGNVSQQYHSAAKWGVSGSATGRGLLQL